MPPSPSPPSLHSESEKQDRDEQKQTLTAERNIQSLFSLSRAKLDRASGELWEEEKHSHANKADFQTIFGPPRDIYISILDNID